MHIPPLSTASHRSKLITPSLHQSPGGRKADTGHRLSWQLTPTRHWPLWSSEFVGSRTSCPHAGRTQAVLVRGAAYSICGKAEGTRRHRFYKNYRWLSNLTGGYHPSMTATPSQPRAPPCFKCRVQCTFLFNHQKVRLKCQMVLASPQNRVIMFSM